MEQKKQRYYNLDIMKCIAIFLVILYHMDIFQSDIIGNPCATSYIKYYLRGLMPMAVPIFFFVNGALLLNKKFDLKTHCIKIAKTIILTIFWVLLTYAIVNYLNAGYVSLLEGARAIIYGLKDGVNNHLWFMYTLVMVYLVFPAFKCIWDNDKKILKYVFVVLFVVTIGTTLINMLRNDVAMALNKYLVGIDFNLFSEFNPVKGIYGYSMVYFLLGGLCFEHRDRLKKKSLTILSSIGLFVSTAGMCLYWVFISRANNQTFDYVWDSYGFIFTFINVICVFIILLNYKSVKIVDKIVVSLSNNTFGIYLLHRIVFALLIFVGVHPTGTLINIALGIGILLVSYAISAVIRLIPGVRRLITF